MVDDKPSPDAPAPGAVPDEVREFHDALRGLGGVVDVASSFDWVADVPERAYSFPGDFGDMPHALLRRGPIPADQAWIKTVIVLSRDERGWIALEFLAWWVRDQSRGGEATQMRVLALPPQGYEVQLGHTLRFAIDLFVESPGRELGPVLAALRACAADIQDSIRSYREGLKQAEAAERG